MKTMIFLFLLLLVSCISHDKTDDIMCTMEYRILTISIRDSAAQPILLDNYFIRKTSTGEILDFSKEEPYTDSINKVNGVYILFTDGKMAMTSKSGTEFEFHGEKNGMEIVNEKYIIGNDLCHVQRISGKSEIIP